MHTIIVFVTTNTRGGLLGISEPLWARDHDAFVVIRRSRDRSQLATLYVKLIWEKVRPLHLPLYFKYHRNLYQVYSAPLPHPLC